MTVNETFAAVLLLASLCLLFVGTVFVLISVAIWLLKQSTICRISGDLYYRRHDIASMGVTLYLIAIALSLAAKLFLET